MCKLCDHSETMHSPVWGCVAPDCTCTNYVPSPRMAIAAKLLARQKGEINKAIARLDNARNEPNLTRCISDLQFAYDSVWRALEDAKAVERMYRNA